MLPNNYLAAPLVEASQGNSFLAESKFSFFRAAGSDLFPGGKINASLQNIVTGLAFGMTLGYFSDEIGLDKKGSLIRLALNILPIAGQMLKAYQSEVRRVDCCGEWIAASIPFLLGFVAGYSAIHYSKLNVTSSAGTLIGAGIIMLDLFVLISQASDIFKIITGDVTEEAPRPGMGV